MLPGRCVFLFFLDFRALPRSNLHLSYQHNADLQVGIRLYDGAQLGIVYQVDALGNRNATMPTLNDKDKDPNWIFNAERRIIYQPTRIKTIGLKSINLVVNALGEEYPVDSTNDRFRVHTLDTVFTPKASIDPEAPPPEIFTDFLIFESAQVMVANMSVAMTPQALRLIELPVIDQDQEGATVVLFSSNRVFFEVFHPLYLPCTQIPPPAEPSRCFIDCFITRQCPRDCDVWQFAYDNAYHTAPLGCNSSASCSAVLANFALNKTGVNVTGRDPTASPTTDSPPVPPRFLPMLQPKMYSTRSVPHVGVRLCLTKGPRISDGDLIRNNTAGLFSFLVESFPNPLSSPPWSTVNIRTFSPSRGFFDSIVNVTIVTVNSAPTFSNASVVTVVQQNTPTHLSIAALTQAADADGDILQFYIVEPPLHGKLFQFPSARSEFDAGSSALAMQYAPGRAASSLGDMLTSMPLESSELLQHPLRKTFPRAPVAQGNVMSAAAFTKNFGFQILGGNTTLGFAEVVCGDLGVHPVEFEYEKAVFISGVYIIGFAGASTSVKYRVLTRADSVGDALPQGSYDFGYRQRKTQSGNPPDIFSGGTSSSDTTRKRSFKYSGFRDRVRQPQWTEVYRGTITRSSAFTSNVWSPTIAPSPQRSRVVRIEFCGTNGAGPGKSNGRDFTMESGVSAIVAGGLNDRSTWRSMVRDANHRVVYVPDDEFSGDDRFSVIVSDWTLLQTQVMTIPLRVQPINDSPIATTLEIFIKASDTIPIVVNLQSFDIDTAQASVAAFIIDAPTAGALKQFTGAAISGSGNRVQVTDAQQRVTFASGGKAGTPLTSFRYLLSDGSSDSKIVTVTIHSLCGKGQRLEQSSLSCAPCPAGYVMPDLVHRHAVCIACQPGYYQSNQGAGACIACPKGFEAPLSATIQCAACKAGYFASEAAIPNCSPCPRGTFQPRRSASSCLQCGSLSYANEIGSTTCNDCPPFSRSSTPSGLDRSVCMCIRGYFDPIGRSGFPCAACPYGAFCAGQQFPPVPYRGFYTDRKLWNPLSQLAMSTGTDNLDIATQYFYDPLNDASTSSSTNAASSGNTSLAAPPPASNGSTLPPPPPPAPSMAVDKGSLDATIADMRPVFFACGLHGNPSACSGYPDTEPFFATMMCRHRPVEGKCAAAGDVVQLNYTSTSRCAAAYTGRLCSECAQGNSRMFDGTCRACSTGLVELLLGCCFFGWLWRAMLSSSKTPFVTLRLSIEWAQLVGAMSLMASPMPGFLRQHLALMQMFNFSPFFLPWACVFPAPPSEEVVATILHQMLPFILFFGALALPLYQRWIMIRENHNRFKLQKKFSEVSQAKRVNLHCTFSVTPSSAPHNRRCARARLNHDAAAVREARSHQVVGGGGTGRLEGHLTMGEVQGEGSVWRLPVLGSTLDR